MQVLIDNIYWYERMIVVCNTIAMLALLVAMASIIAARR